MRQVEPRGPHVTGEQYAIDSGIGLASEHGESPADGAAHRNVELIGDSAPNVVRLEHFIERRHLAYSGS